MELVYVSTSYSDRFLTIPIEERTFDNTIRTWDSLEGKISQAISCMSALAQIHPEIYGACLKVEKDSSDLSEAEEYYLKEILSQFWLKGS